MAWKNNAGDGAINTSAKASGLAKAVLVTSIGLPLAKQAERNDATKWNQTADMIEVTLRKWTEATQGDGNIAPNS